MFATTASRSCASATTPCWTSITTSAVRGRSGRVVIGSSFAGRTRSLGRVTVGRSTDRATSSGEPGRVLLSIDVPDVDALLSRVAELGGRVTGGPTDMPWGQRVLHVRDPDGNAVNLTQRL
ncbi:VOC family protein [Geodermatophilus sp. URMC 64]